MLTDKGRKFRNNVILLAAIGIGGFLLYQGANRGYLGKSMASLVPKHIDTNALVDTAGGSFKPTVALAAFPSTVPAGLPGPVLPCEIWGWNANAGMILASSIESDRIPTWTAGQTSRMRRMVDAWL